MKINNDIKFDDYNTKTLNMCFQGLTSLKAIEKFKNLEILKVFNNKLTSLDGIESLKNLKVLQAFSNEIEDISALYDLNKLEIINLDSNKIKHFDIGDKPFLETLYIDNNRIDFIPEVKYPRLKEFDFINNNLTNRNLYNFIKLNDSIARVVSRSLNREKILSQLKLKLIEEYTKNM